jgi:hypothetical protein
LDAPLKLSLDPCQEIAMPDARLGLDQVAADLTAPSNAAASCCGRSRRHREAIVDYFYLPEGLYVIGNNRFEGQKQIQASTQGASTAP